VAFAGGKSQLREQTGGVHYRGQNDGTIHFGLGENSVVDELQIRWPSGQLQTLNNIQADQILEVHEVELVNSSSVPREPISIKGCFPNPFNPSVEISFSLNQSRSIDLMIFDSSGSLVRQLENGTVYPEGENSIAWNGKDSKGRTLPSGIYFFSLSSGDFVNTGKMTLIK